MNIMLKFLLRNKVPLKMDSLWLSWDLPNVKNRGDKSHGLKKYKPKGMKYHKDILNTKNYPRIGEKIKVFRDKKYFYEYECTGSKKRSDLTSDPAFWDNCIKYDLKLINRGLL